MTFLPRTRPKPSNLCTPFNFLAYPPLTEIFPSIIWWNKEYYVSLRRKAIRYAQKTIKQYDKEEVVH